MLLDDQDEALWDTGRIDEGKAALDRALSLRRPGAVPAAGGDRRAPHGAAARRRADRRASTRGCTSSHRPPVVELNHALAVAEADGARGRAWRCSTSSTSTAYHYLHSARADLLRRLERYGEARAAYERALELAHADAERHFLERRLGEIDL